MILSLDKDYNAQHLSVVSHGAFSYVGLLKKNKPLGSFLDSGGRFFWYPIEDDVLVEILWGDLGIKTIGKPQ